MLNLRFFVEAEASTFEIHINQGSYLVNADGSQGTHNAIGIDNAALDFRRPADRPVFSFLDGVVVGAFAGYTDLDYSLSPTTGPATFGNYVTVRYNSPDAGGVFYATFAHLARNSAEAWLDRLAEKPGGVDVRTGDFLGVVADVDETPYPVHLHVNFARTLLVDSKYAAPNLIADSSVSTANAQLLGLLTIDGLSVAGAAIGDYVTANVIGNGSAAGDYLAGAGLGDILRGFDGSDTLVGGDGNDTLEGGSGDDYLDGGTGTDRLIGGIGNDVYAATQNDIIVELANEGFDAVWVLGGTSYVMPNNVEMMLFDEGQPLDANGNALANIMVGNGNANILQGLGGADQIDGGAGADTLIGGVGRDSLHGGAGADQFRFDAINHSTVAAPDLIVDFTFTASEQDRINLSGIDADSLTAGNQAFVYIGSAGFSGAAGELRFTVTAGLGYAVAGDTNGDKLRDIVINVLSATPPNADWFIL